MHDTDVSTLQKRNIFASGSAKVILKYLHVVLNTSARAGFSEGILILNCCRTEKIGATYLSLVISSSKCFYPSSYEMLSFTTLVLDTWGSFTLNTTVRFSDLFKTSLLKDIVYKLSVKFIREHFKNNTEKFSTTHKI